MQTRVIAKKDKRIEALEVELDRWQRYARALEKAHEDCKRRHISHDEIVREKREAIERLECHKAREV